MLPSEILDSAGLDSNEVPGFNLQSSKGRVASEASRFTGEPDSSQYKFEAETLFDAQFEEAGFDLATFHQEAWLGSSTFAGYTGFDGTTFKKKMDLPASLREATIYSIF